METPFVKPTFSKSSRRLRRFQGVKIPVYVLSSVTQGKLRSLEMSRARLEDGEISVTNPLAFNFGLISVLALPTPPQDIISKADQWGHSGESSRIGPFAEVCDVSLATRALAGFCAKSLLSSSSSS